MIRRLASLSINLLVLTALALVAYTDAALPAVTVNADFVTTFFVAGKLVLAGHCQDLYPPVGSTTFAGTAFDKAAHSVLHNLSSGAVAEYMYPPAVAVICAAFAKFSPVQALVLFQILSVAALYICAYLVVERRSKAAHLSGVSILFLPVAVTIWIGQVGIVLGLLPLAAGYCLLERSRPYLSGLAWSLLIFKPQLLLVAAMVAAAYALAGRPKCLLALLAGTVLWLGVNICCTSPSLFFNWLDCLKTSDIVYADPRQGIPAHLVVSLPRLVLLAAPASLHQLLRPVFYALAATVAGATVWCLSRLIKSDVNSQGSLVIAGSSASRMKREGPGGQGDVLSFCVTVALLVLPLVSPYLFVYDLCVMVLAGWLIFCRTWSSPTRLLRHAVVAVWTFVNIYYALIMLHSSWVSPAAVVALFAFLYVLAVLECVSLTVANRRAALGVPVVGTDGANF